MNIRNSIISITGNNENIAKQLYMAKQSHIAKQSHMDHKEN
jgi:hypothetical protein